MIRNHWSPVVQSSACVALQVLAVGVRAGDERALLRCKQTLALAGQRQQLQSTAAHVAVAAGVGQGQ
jgi:hypothetical protein